MTLTQIKNKFDKEVEKQEQLEKEISERSRKFKMIAKTAPAKKVVEAEKALIQLRKEHARSQEKCVMLDSFRMRAVMTAAMLLRNFPDAA